MSRVHDHILEYLKEATRQTIASHDKYSAEQPYVEEQRIISRDTLNNLLEIVDTAYELGKLAAQQEKEPDNA
jgi:hypothetical protein